MSTTNDEIATGDKGMRGRYIEIPEVEIKMTEEEFRYGLLRRIHALEDATNAIMAMGDDEFLEAGDFASTSRDGAFADLFQFCLIAWKDGRND